MASGKNLYDLPFEQRIRIKYFSLGLILGVSVIGLLALIGVVTQIITSIVLDKELDKQRLNDGILFSLFSMFAPLAYWLWYSKEKPKKYPHLDETVGLKQDYEKIKGA